ncbi:C-type mannose receptor 2-like [Toxotes jaculatrix]|uniref:C-type mannose receptor 2-like n=1 Tax=Toxotes jaculatrix TaxID=941984 RepID=UPI001B3A9C84|nr:C-type mannose receptor 2-like [Toxotes jaculatrix]
MRKILWFVLALSGLSAVSTSIFSEYHYVRESMSWSEAQSYCRNEFTDLASVAHQYDNSRLLRVIQVLGKFAWIGLYDDLTTWRWALGFEDFNNNTDFSYWYSNEPDNKNSTESCTVMTQKGFWKDIKCTHKCPAVCFYEQGQSKYILVQTEMTWYEARIYCETYYEGLASVKSMSENNQISSLLSESSWIGLYRWQWDNWADSWRTTYTNWHISQPDNSGDTITSCAAVNTTTGTWWDVDCEEKHHFICQKKYFSPSSSPRPQHKTLLKLKFQSEADLQDPALQQQILQQLHAKLEKHGLPDFKLRWVQSGEQAFHKEQTQKKEEGSSA